MQTAPWQGHTGHLQTGPSKWWAWGLAIFMCIQVFFTLIGTLISAIIPYDMFLDDWDVEEPGEYPANGTSEEQDDWNFTKEEWDSYVAITAMMEDMDDRHGCHRDVVPAKSKWIQSRLRLVGNLYNCRSLDAIQNAIHYERIILQHAC